MTTDDKVIVLFGETGTGKSYFIRKISGAQDVEVGHSLASCTQKVKVFKCEIQGKNTFLLDTPGFNDTYRSDAEILEEISTLLASLHVAGAKICGLIYIHKIDEVRMKANAVKNLNIFKALCGEAGLKNTILLTNRWDLVDKSIGEKREDELKNNFWKDMISEGCRVERFTNKQQDIDRIFEYLFKKEPIVLNIQREMIDEDKKIEETSAGRVILGEITKSEKEYNEALSTFEEEKRNHPQQSDMFAEQNSEYLEKIRQLEQDKLNMRERYNEDMRQQVLIIKEERTSLIIDRVFKLVCGAAVIAIHYFANKRNIKVPSQVISGLLESSHSNNNR